MKLAFVVQRYGAQVNGGAELHARYIVELLAKQHQVEVLTTCSRDYVTWRNEWPEGTETMRGVSVRRFRVSRERDPEDFGRRSAHVFGDRHSVADELAWLESEGPTSPELIAHLQRHASGYDYIFFFSYRYYLAYHGTRAVASKAILVPTAERDSAIGLSIFGPIFRGVRAIMYNTPEERLMIQAATENTRVPGVVVGVGSDVPRNPVASRFRRKYRIDDPFIIYIGRIDENKGCGELFSFFTTYRPRLGQRLKLVLIGQSIIPIPEHPNVHHLGFVSDQDKFDALAAADALVMPSYYESLSMVALEAWALGKPVLANGKCDVLRGQCIRSRAGLYYESFAEFAETLFTLTTHRSMAEALGENGRTYFEQHYSWPVIERKYQDVLDHLAREDKAGGRASSGPESLPGWMARRRKVLPPATDVLKTLPGGAVIDDPAALSSGLVFGESSSATRTSATAAAESAAGYSGASAMGFVSSESSSSSSSSSSSASSSSASGDRGGSRFSGRTARGVQSGSGSGDRERTGRDRGDRGERDRGDRGERDRGTDEKARDARPSPAGASGDATDRRPRGRDRDRDRGRSGKPRGAGDRPGRSSGSGSGTESGAATGSESSAERPSTERRERRPRSGDASRPRGDGQPGGGRPDAGPKPEGSAERRPRRDGVRRSRRPRDGRSGSRGSGGQGSGGQGGGSNSGGSGNGGAGSGGGQS